MIDIKVTGIKELQAELQDFSERRLRAAVATAMTRTAVQVRERLRADLRTAIDRPTPYTVRQLKYAGATAQRPVARSAESSRLRPARTKSSGRFRWAASSAQARSTS